MSKRFSSGISKSKPLFCKGLQGDLLLGASAGNGERSGLQISPVLYLCRFESAYILELGEVSLKIRAAGVEIESSDLFWMASTSKCFPSSSNSVVRLPPISMPKDHLFGFRHMLLAQAARTTRQGT